MNGNLDKIKSRGFWKFTIHPIEFEENRITPLLQCWETISHCSVLLRGWDVPHIEDRDRQVGNDYVGLDCDFRSQIESWRFYQSGLFLQFKSMREDWFEAEERYGRGIPCNPGEKIDLVETVYRITEIFELAHRLITQNVFNNELRIKVELFGTENRSVASLFKARMLRPNHTANVNLIEFDKTYEIPEFLSKHKEFALGCAAYIFQRFNWIDVSGPAFRDIQSELYKK